MDGSDESPVVNIDGIEIHRVVRNKCKFDSERNKINIGSRGKLCGPGDGKVGIVDYNGRSAKDIIKEAEEMFRKEHDPEKKMKTLPTDAWFEYVKDRRPLLMIYLMDLNLEDGQKDNVNFSKLKKDMHSCPFSAFMIGFPRNEEWSSMSFTKYKANKSYNYYDRHFDEELEEV